MEWIQDPGHGWLKVSKSEYPDAYKSGTGYGYQDSTHVYLEEDCEAFHFLRHHPEIDASALPTRYVRDFNRNMAKLPRQWDPYVNGAPSAELLEISSL